MGDRRIISYRGELVPFIRLRSFFELERRLGAEGADIEEGPTIEQIVIASAQEYRVGLVVDQVLGDFQTVIKPLGRMYRDVDGVSGATILGDGTVALILDVNRLAFVVQRGERPQGRGGESADGHGCALRCEHRARAVARSPRSSPRPATLSDADFRRLVGIHRERARHPHARDQAHHARIAPSEAAAAIRLRSLQGLCRLRILGRGPRVRAHQHDRRRDDQQDRFLPRGRAFRLSRRKILPAAEARDGAGVSRPFTVWSAGCSTGEEPYTIAMVLEERRGLDPRFSYRIFASDLSTQVLGKAAGGAYTRRRRPMSCR